MNDHDNLRDTIGQALSDEIAAGAEQPDWCDSREIDRLADAVIAVLAPTVQDAEQGMPELPPAEIGLHDDGHFTWRNGGPHVARYAGWKGCAFTAEQMYEVILADRAQRAAVADASGDDEIADCKLGGSCQCRSEDGCASESCKFYLRATPTASTPPKPKDTP